MPIVIIPWRAQPSRLAALDAVVSWYRDEFPDADIRLVDSGDEVFNLAQCRNLGIVGAGAPDAVVVVNDADTIPEAASLREAIAAASLSGLVHLPYTEYRWLGAAGMAQFVGGTPLAECEFELVRGACSGVYVTTPRSWAAHGGQDERFRGWGYEDAAWYLAHETLLGEPPRRHPGRVFALHHVAETRSGAQYDANAALMQRYRDAGGDPGAMRELVDEAMAANARALPGD
ncbi:hypothetical protein BH11ACT4_BH11ACT4_02940 [soil metagenome]